MKILLLKFVHLINRYFNTKLVFSKNKLIFGKNNFENWKYSIFNRLHSSCFTRYHLSRTIWVQTSVDFYLKHHDIPQPSARSWKGASNKMKKIVMKIKKLVTQFHLVWNLKFWFLKKATLKYLENVHASLSFSNLFYRPARSY